MYLTPHEVCENCIFEFESYNTSCYNNTNICTCFIKYPFNLILRFPVMSYGFYYFGNAIIIQKISQVVKTFQQKMFHLLLLSSYYLHICKQVRVAYLRLGFFLHRYTHFFHSFIFLRYCFHICPRLELTLMTLVPSTF